MSNALLEVKHLNVDYLAASGTVRAVADVSFTLQRGQIFGLAGESGCGKSTLAYAITRLLRPPAQISGGEIIYHPRNGAPVDILTMTPAQLRGFRWNELSIVFQSAMNALNPVMTVGTQIMDVLEAHRPQMKRAQRKTRAEELLRLVGISADRLSSYPHEMSGGMRQRAIIAIALALEPELIIMDEPTTALDVVVQREILTEIMRLREQLNFSVIFITHDLSLLIEVSDAITIMYAGRIIEQATQTDLHRHPRHPYSYGLINSFPSLHGPRRRATGIAGSPPDLRAVPAGCAFHPRCPFVFDMCRTVRPVLAPADAASPMQEVACHLYTPAYHATPPTSADMAASYESLATGGSAR